jgi:hypothetical protein
MDPEAFIRWALDDARTLEERYTTELLVDHGEMRWLSKRQLRTRHWEESLAIHRERFLNPAYQPAYTERSVRRAAEMLEFFTEWHISAHPSLDRPVRDLSVLRFLPLQKLQVKCDAADAAVFADLPHLRELSFDSPVCEDLRPIARCTGLRRLSLTFGLPWPEVDGLETLQQLEALHLTGNLLVFRPGLTFPRVRDGTLKCTPLQARSLRELPQFPDCELLTLEGVERLDGLEAWRRLRNLDLTGPVRDFTPIAALPALTCLSYHDGLPLDITPLVRAPALLHASFTAHHPFGEDKAPPRDYSPLLASPTLRQLHVAGCPPLALEVAALDAALPGWDDLFLLPEPRPVPPLRIIIAPHQKHPSRLVISPDALPPELPDWGLLRCRAKWLKRHGQAFLTARTGHADWGRLTTSENTNGICLWFECYELLPRFAEILDHARALLASLRSEYVACLYLCLKVQPPKPSPAQAELERQFREKRDEEDFERRRREQADSYERLHLLQLKQQQGEPIDPAEFSPAPQGSLRPAPQPNRGRRRRRRNRPRLRRPLRRRRRRQASRPSAP